MKKPLNKITKKSGTKTGGKKPTKTTTKKSFVDIKPVKILNKKNALAFAEYLYKEKDDGKSVFCSYVKMCEGTLQDNINKKKALSCILGEAYMYFINPKFSEKELNVEVDRHVNEQINLSNKNSSYFECLYKEPEELISLILAKNSSSNRKHLLQDRLNKLPRANDNVTCGVDGWGEIEFVARAKVMKDEWMNSIVPLLK